MADSIISFKQLAGNTPTSGCNGRKKKEEDEEDDDEEDDDEEDDDAIND